MIESKIFFSHNLAGNISHYGAIQWSADNRIAVSTDKGITIFASVTSPSELALPMPFHKTFIPAPTETLCFDVGINREELHTQLEKDDLYLLMLDHTLSPLTSNAPAFLGYRQVKWSPLGVEKYGCCVLASLTMDHRLVIYHDPKNPGKWEEAEDLSLKLYYHHKAAMSEEPVEQLAAENKLQLLNDRLYHLAAVEMVWTDLFEVQSGGTLHQICFLIVAMKSGHVICWKVEGSSIKDCEPWLEWYSELGLISSLAWHRTSLTGGLLALGCDSGQLAVVALGLGDGDLVITSSCLLWEKDRPAVRHIAILPTPQTGQYLVVGTKENHLVHCLVKDTGQELAAGVCRDTRGIFSQNIKGLWACTQDLLIVSQDGYILEVSTQWQDSEEVTLKQEEISLEIERAKLLPQGVTMSPNGALCAVVMNISCLYDHLVIREPIQVHVFTTWTMDKVSEALLSRVEKPQELYCWADMLDVMRGLLASGQSLPNPMAAAVVQDSAATTSLPLLHLIRYLLKVSLVGAPVEEPRTKQLEQRVLETESLIMKENILRRVAQLELGELTEKQQLSLLLQCDWLLSAHGLLLEQAYSALGQSSNSDPRENCPICQSPVPLDQLRHGICKDGHWIPRCCHSLLLCGSSRYLVCQACQALCLREPVWAPSLHCTFCSAFIRFSPI